MNTLSPEQRKEYLENFGVECPSCGSDDITTTDWDYGIGEVWSNVRCRQCGEKWTDIYKLTGVEQYER